jgi:outer membrane usher protein
MRPNPGFSLRRFNLVCLLLGAVLCANTLAAAATPVDELQEAVMSVTVNAQSQSEMLVMLRDGTGALWIDVEDFEKLRLPRPSGAARDFRGRQYLPLSTIVGSDIVVDEATQSIALQVPAEQLTVTRSESASRPAPVLTNASPGAFLNYQLSAQRVAGEDLTGAFGELGAFTSRGVITNSGVVRSLAGQSGAVRLDTTFTTDFPARIERLTVGDAVSDGSTWGSAVRFGGIGWSRNFSLRPDLLTTPLLSATGTAVVPSTVDVYINNQQVSSSTLPPGPFVVDRLPAVTGAGQVTVVVRDALGREQQLTQPFYSSLQLLAPGLSQYEVDLGKVRRDYTISSLDYGPVMGSASYRRGLSNAFTLETHAEFLEREAHAAGLAGAAALGHFAVVNFTAAAGGGVDTSGSLYGLGLERQGARFSVGYNHTVATAGYRQIATAEEPARQFRQRDLAQVGINLREAGSLVAVLAHQSFAALPSEDTASLSYSRNLGERGAFNVTATRSDQGGQVGRSVFVTFTYSLAERTAVVLTANGGDGPGAPPNEMFANYIENPPRGAGEGYRLGLSTIGNYNAQFTAQRQSGELQLQAARSQGVSGVSGFWSGAATLLGGELNAARQVGDSFALVDVGGLPDVPVYVDNQLITHTDQHGRALIHDLLPYENNRVNIEPTEIPLDASIGARTLVVTPAYRSGVIVSFPVERVHGATFRLVTADGQVVPAGATVEFQGNRFPVTFEGTTYVTGYERAAEGTAQWDRSRCTFQVGPPPKDDPQPDMGTLSCRALDDQGPAP